MDEQNKTKLNIDDATTELDMCKKQVEEYLNNWKRERADFVNYKKEEAKRMEEFVGFANQAIIVEFLDVMDSLYSASSGDGAEGVIQIIKKAEDWLKKHGVEKIKAEDKFDPLMHEAVESEDGGERLEEVRPGYIMNGRVIRPGRVRIVK
ncbi:MAG TPA: nucleotide exchange factor GrpE [Candidatus Paceibacterota bacterium]